MIDFSVTYELTGCSDQAFVSPRWKHLRLKGFAVGRGEANVPREMTFVREAGRCQADIIGTGYASLYLISARLAEGLTADGITGWRSTPIRFEDGTAADGAFHALSVTGRCGRILDERSEVIEKPLAGRVTKWWKGMYFDPATWDGSDIFTPIDLGTIFVVSRVRELLRLYDLDGVTPEPLSAIERLILPCLLRH